MRLDTRTTRRWGGLAAILLLAGLLLACGDDGGAAVEDGTAPTVADIAPTDPAAEPVPVELTLSGEGIGDLRFGAPAALVTAPIDAAFGPPTIDSYIGEPIGNGRYVSLLGSPSDRANSWGYAHPALQIRCHPNGLCVVLGGASLSELAFTGWTYSTQADENGRPVDAESVRTVDGVTLGSSTADFPGVVTRTRPGCASSAGFANAAGSITATFDDFWDGEGRRPEPAPGTELVVASMSAGTVMTYGDGCA